ncbi:group 1 glycosyl transferase [Sporocytophaga myxococcoides]|uniref:Group 1 glycosyl transferase n=2 Tax=Sporocytophaga myxococcoides TaxID=153721 RepID=A0A098LAR2_9BACT|nr:group 1 glycosyl transferase [Sporocytophaga myxococcoides]
METGGIESHILEFCHKISESGIKIDLVVPNFKMTLDNELKLKKVCNSVYISRNREGWKRYLWLLMIALVIGMKRYNALYTNGQGESIGFFEKFIRFKNRWIHHHHTSGDTHDMDTWGGNYWKSLMAANEVIACSNRNAESLNKILNRDVKSIPCFSRQIVISQKEGRTSGNVSLGYFGRLIPEKGIDTICRLSEDPELKNIEFHIWGEGVAYPPGSFYNFPSVKYHGKFYSLEELKNAISSLDGFLLLSTHSEGLPISLLEVMSAGLPWLATNRGGIPDIACDPVSTRVIAATPTYEEVKLAVLNLAEDIRSGKISRETQMHLYNTKFSSSALTSQWRMILNLEE